MSESIEDQLARTPCPSCGELTLTLEVRDEPRLTARPLGTWSLAGYQPKVSAVVDIVSWPYAVCTTDGCGFERRATRANRGG